MRWRLRLASPRLGLVSSSIGERKADHLALCAEEDVGFRQRTTLLECVRLVHDALPDLATAAIDTRVTLFDRQLRAPMLIASMTGGTRTMSPTASLLTGPSVASPSRRGTNCAPTSWPWWRSTLR